MAESMKAERAEELRRAALTYAEVGGTPNMQPGYLNFRSSRALSGRDFEATADKLMTWKMHEGAGLKVRASAERVAEGVVVEMRLGPGPFALRIPCRVVYVVAEEQRVGFAYGTLPGHPERGEELFLVERRQDGSLVATVTAFSRPATFLARMGGPISRAIQRLMTKRYLQVLDA
jgi:uncharacterized protein (UPF0548 family)